MAVSATGSSALPSDSLLFSLSLAISVTGSSLVFPLSSTLSLSIAVSATGLISLCLLAPCLSPYLQQFQPLAYQSHSLTAQSSRLYPFQHPHKYRFSLLKFAAWY
ncbi:hypothetical protein OIU76_018488 [Salix suchowensis]|nr:hypothetical protein OIU76_018488 [Salix suchowensis]